MPDKEIRGKMERIGIDLFFLLVCSAVIIFMTEMICRDSVLKTSEWFWSYKWNTLYNMLLLFWLEVLFYALTSSATAGFLVVSILSYLVALVNAFKYQAKGDALRLSDLYSAVEGLKVAGEYSFRIPFPFYMALLVTMVLVWILHVRGRWRRKECYLLRTVVIVLCVTAIRLCYFTESGRGLVGGDTTITIVKNFYETNGFAAGFLRTASQEIKKPVGYSKKHVEELLSQIKLSDEVVQKDIQPDIIVVLMESLYDMTRLNDVDFNTDPLEDFKKLQENAISGMMLTPVRGGGTCNAEYELLTGYPVSNTSSVDLIYQSGIIRRNPGSILDSLKSSGYSALAIHANDGSFFNRTDIYSKMGFDQMVFKEDMSGYTREGTWISDRSLYERLIEEYENRDTGKKFFALALTMQLHGGYGYDYNKYGIFCEGNGIAGSQAASLNTYANLEYGSVLALMELLDYFSTVHHPVVVLAFGDHAPGMEAFGLEGVTNPANGNEEFYTLQTTPFLIWNNYTQDVQDWGTVSSYKLGARLMQYCKVDLDSYFTCLLDETVPEGSGMFFADEGKLVHRNTLKESTAEVLDKLWLLQYDRMFGENYAEMDKQ